MSVAVRAWNRISAPMVAEIALVVALALLLRTFDLLRLPIYTDESTFLHWGADVWDKRTWVALLAPLTEDGKLPLFMWLAGAATRFFSEPLLGGRLVSALAGTSSAAGLYLAGYWLAGRRVALLSGLLYALVPFNLFFDRMALVEGLLTATGVWTLTFSIFIAAKARDDRQSTLAGILVGAALTLGLWTKTTALFMLAFPALCALLLSRRQQLAVSFKGFAVGYAVFVLSLGLLLLLPDPWHIMDKAQSFSISTDQLLSIPWGMWMANLQAYWSWLQIYLPAPVWCLALVAAPWAAVRRDRRAMLLVACWVAFTLPSVMTVYNWVFTTRYVVPGVFPLLLLTADLLAWGWDLAGRSLARSLPMGLSSNGQWSRVLAGLLFLAMVGPALRFDADLLRAPETVELAATDRYHYITAWSAGYGFAEAMQLVKQRAADLTRNGQPIIVLADDPQGIPYDGLRLYLRGMPQVFCYVDMHLSRDAPGFMAAWRPHHVPLLVVGNQGKDDLDAFEQGVPQAKRIGFFPKPGGRSSFRVYEVDAADLD